MTRDQHSGGGAGGPSPPPSREIERVWTDGACEDNGKPEAFAGWGVFYGRMGDPRNRHEPLQGPVQTNQRAELRAAIEAMKYLNSQPVPGPSQHRTVATDSEYVIKGAGNVIRWAKQGWRRDDGSGVANIDLWEEMAILMTLCEGMVKLVHVYGHSGDKGNDGADRMAVWGAFGRDMGEDTNGRNETPKRKRAKIVAKKKRRAEKIQERRRAIQKETKEREKRKRDQAKSVNEERKKMRRVMEGVDKLRNYRSEKQRAEEQGLPVPEYPDIHKCIKCGWPGHAKPAVGMCPLHPKYVGQLPRCHYNRQQAKEWLLERQRWSVLQEARRVKQKPWICGLCDRRHRTKSQKLQCTRQCSTGLRCVTVGCDHVARTVEGLNAHKRMCNFKKRCPHCGIWFKNSVTNADGAEVANGTGRRLKKAAYILHTRWAKAKASILVCRSPDCDRKIRVPACVMPGYETSGKKQNWKMVAEWQARKSKWCFNHRPDAGRSNMRDDTGMEEAEREVTMMRREAEEDENNASQYDEDEQEIREEMMFAYEEYLYEEYDRIHGPAMMVTPTTLPPRPESPNGVEGLDSGDELLEEAYRWRDWNRGL